MPEGGVVCSLCTSISLVVGICFHETRASIYLRDTMKGFQRWSSSWLKVATWWVLLRHGSCLTSLEACEDFGDHMAGSSQPWVLEDCVKVWDAWSHTIYTGTRGGVVLTSHHDVLDHGYPDREVFQSLSTTLRSQGTPCLVKGKVSYDGVGSSTIRHMSSWLYAKELGCDWITPDFNQGDVTQLSRGGHGLYCHRTEYVFKFNATAPLEQGTERRRCINVTWLYFFRMDQHSVLPPSTGVTRVVEVMP